MKIGITIPDYYKEYLAEVAKLNGISITSICSVIVDNFLSFNKSQKRFPVIRKTFQIVFAKKSNSVVEESPSDAVPADRQVLNERLKACSLSDTELVDCFPFDCED